MKTLLVVKLAFLPLVAFWLGAPWLVGDARAAALLVAGSQALLGAAMATSVVLRRPWTMAFSRAQYAGMQHDPLFLKINGILSGLWAAVFIHLAAARVVGLSAIASWTPLGAAALLSALLPAVLVRRALRRRLDALDPYPWKPAPRQPSADADAIVVGAGLGGLTTAALLAEGGLRVIVVEQHVVAGGFAHHWLRKGRDGDARPVFRFDSGVHDISGVWHGAPVHGLLRRLGVLDRLQWLPMDHRFQRGDDVFDVPRGWDAYVAALAARHPGARADLVRTMADLRAIHAAMYSEAPARSGVPGVPRTVDGMLRFARRHPQALQWMPRPFDAFLSERIADPAARRALSALAGYVTDDVAKATVADMVPLFGYALHGGFYPAGGSGRLAQALVAAIHARGGEVRLRTPVARVCVEHGVAAGVALARGGTLRAGAVVLNADLPAGANGLVDPALWPAPFREQLAALRPACSAVGVHLGIRGRFDGVPPIIHVDGPQGAVGIVLPSAVDRSAAPDGYGTVELLRLLPHAEACDWLGDAGPADVDTLRRTPSYLARKRKAGDALIRAAEQALPGLAERIVLRADAGPATFLRYDWSSAGSIYGVEGGAGRVAVKSPIPGLLFAGAATHGPGVEAVMISGAEAAEALVPGLLSTPPARAPAGEPRVTATTGDGSAVAAVRAG